MYEPFQGDNYATAVTEKAIQLAKSGTVSCRGCEMCANIGVIIVCRLAGSQTDGHILAFLTGQREIDTAVESARRILGGGNKDFIVLPLHGKLTSDQQSMVTAWLAIAQQSLFG